MNDRVGSDRSSGFVLGHRVKNFRKLAAPASELRSLSDIMTDSRTDGHCGEKSDKLTGIGPQNSY
jgi:hypothetical protein